LPGIRLYADADRAQLECFRCAPYGKKWCVAAERIIHEAPGDIAAGEVEADIYVADDGGKVVGAIVIGPDPTDPEIDTVFSLGVLLERQNQGIGTELKYAAMVAIVENGRSLVGSEVHRRNAPMIAVNAKLGVTSWKNPEDGDYLLTLGLVAAPSSDGSSPEGQRRTK
jgi:GNAT superfamily N-acetyltransferase